MNIEEHIPLADLSTFHIGGPARFFARAQSVGDIKAALAFAKERQLKIFILGGGSNILVPDEGFSGLVIKVELMGVEVEGEVYTAAAGERWDDLCERAARDGVWGVENLSGIPGSVGGACVQNIGAYGAALSEVCRWVDVFDMESGEVRRLEGGECRFGYRDSIFKHESRYIVLGAAFALSKKAAPDLSYKDLAARFEGKTPSLADIRSAVLDIRAAKFPDLAKEGTAGSFFLNPIVPAEAAQALKERYPDMPLFDMPETPDIKVPLGWLLDHVLNLRGHAEGPVRLFEKQALVITARRDARSADVRALAQKIKKEVKEKTGLDITEEVKIL